MYSKISDSCIRRHEAHLSCQGCGNIIQRNNIMSDEKDKQITNESAPVPFESSVYIWNSRMLFLRKSIASTEHRHHAVQICIGLEGPVGVRDDNKIYREHRAVLIDTECPHTIEAADARHAFLFIEPELSVVQKIRERHLAGEKIRELDFTPLRPFAERLLNCYDRPHSCVEIGGLMDDILFAVAGTGKTIQTLDYRIRKALSLIAEADEKISPRDIAHSVELSEGRLQHLFKEQVGVPIRQYRLWRKLILAIRHISQFDIITHAAYEAGFADSAHMSRTFKRMFGISISEILKTSRPGARLALHICGE